MPTKKPMAQGRLCLTLLASAAMALNAGVVIADPAVQPQSIAFYYGHEPAENELQMFDVAVVEPDSGFVPQQSPPSTTRWVAYVSVGEVYPSKSYYPAIPPAWIVGRNDTWQSKVVDQTAAGWPEFFVEQVIAPLWDKGFRGFFLDTLDSYQLIDESDEERARSRQGLIRVIRTLRMRFPDAMLILNRGFEILPAVHRDVKAVAFESLFRGWNQDRGEYFEVPAADREWLLAQARTAQTKFGVAIIAIDYCDPSDVECAQSTAKQIRALGFIPYIGDATLQHVNLATATRERTDDRRAVMEEEL